MLVWNVRRSLDKIYLLFAGIACLFIGGVDLVHDLACKGMGVLEAMRKIAPDKSGRALILFAIEDATEKTAKASKG